MIRLAATVDAESVTYTPPAPTAAFLTGAGACDTDFSGGAGPVTFSLRIDGSSEDITLDADYTNIAGVIAAIEAQHVDAVVTENGGVLTIASPTTGASSDVRIEDYLESGTGDAGLGDGLSTGVDTPPAVVGASNVQEAIDMIATVMANPVAITFTAAVPGVDNVVRIGPAGLEILNTTGDSPVWWVDKDGWVTGRKVQVFDAGNNRKSFETSTDLASEDDDAVGFFGGEVTKATRPTIDPTGLTGATLDVVNLLISLGLVIDGS